MNNKNSKALILSIGIGLIFATTLSIFFSLFQDVLYALEIKRVSWNFLPFKVYDKPFLLSIIFSFLSSILGFIYGYQYYCSRHLLDNGFKKHKATYQIQFMCWALLLFVGRLTWWWEMYSNVVIQPQDIFLLEPTLSISGGLILLFITIFSVNHLKQSGIDFNTKHIVFTLVSIALFSVTISSFDFINRRQLENIGMGNHPYYQSVFDLPTSHYKKDLNRRKTNNIFDFALVKQSLSNEIGFYYENTHYPLSKLKDFIYSIEPRYSSIGVKYVWHIDESIKLQEAIPYFYIFYRLYKTKHYIRAKNKSFNNMSYQFLRLNKSLFIDLEIQNSHKTIPKLPEELNFNDEKSIQEMKENPLFTFSSTPDGLKYKDQTINKQALNKMLNAAFKSDSIPNKHMILSTDYNQDIQSFISNRSLIFNSVNKLREKYSKEHFDIDFRRLGENQQKDIRKKFPIYLIEIGVGE